MPRQVAVQVYEGDGDDPRVGELSLNADMMGCTRLKAWNDGRMSFDVHTMRAALALRDELLKHVGARIHLHLFSSYFEMEKGTKHRETGTIDHDGISVITGVTMRHVGNDYHQIMASIQRA